jgi:hypothetical protein
MMERSSSASRYGEVSRYHEKCPESFIDRIAHFTDVDGGKRGFGYFEG